MPFFVKTEIIKKEYLINNDLKRKIINEHIDWVKKLKKEGINICLLYTSPSPRDATLSRMPSSA